MNLIAGVLTILCVTCHGTGAVETQATKHTYYDLYTYIFNETEYKKEIRPAQNEKDALLVFILFNLLSIVEVDEKQQTLITTARLNIVWEDSFLAWQKENYDNIIEILVPQSKVYLPDVVLGNSVTPQMLLGHDGLPVRLHQMGLIEWEPTLMLSTSCHIDITYFPFDTQKCFIDFETAVSMSKEINIKVLQNLSTINVQDFTTNGQWELVDSKAENLENESMKSKIRFTLIIKRRRTFFIMNIVLPVFFLSLTASLIFALPADEGEKMGTGITVVLAFAVNLTMVSDLVPMTSLQVSILGLYLTTLLGMSAISLIFVAVILRLHFRDPERPVGPGVKRAIRVLRRIFCLLPSVTIVEPISLSRTTTERGKNEPHSSSDSATSSVSNTSSLEPITWQIVAHTLDVICLVFFSFMTLAITLFCLLSLSIGSFYHAPTL